jgi:hypothetical protein
VGRIGVTEVERDVDDLPGRVVEHALRLCEAGPRNHPGEGQALGVQAELERARAQAYRLRDEMDVGVAVGEKRGDDRCTARPTSSTAMNRSAAMSYGTTTMCVTTRWTPGVCSATCRAISTWLGDLASPMMNAVPFTTRC